jgi:hypothetical protein
VNAGKVLHDLWREGRSVPFSWDGRNDCLGWAGRVAQGITGINPARHLVGTYDTMLGARRVMAANDWKTMTDVVLSLGLSPVETSQAQSGCWAIIDNGIGEQLVGVFWGANIAAKTQTGMGLVPRSRALRAFSIHLGWV